MNRGQNLSPPDRSDVIEVEIVSDQWTMELRVECSAYVNINTAFMWGNHDETLELSISQHHAHPMGKGFQTMQLIVYSDVGVAPCDFKTWQNELRLCENQVQQNYLSQGITDGFRIVSDDSIPHNECKNYKSCDDVPARAYLNFNIPASVSGILVAWCKGLANILLWHKTQFRPTVCTLHIQRNIKFCSTMYGTSRVFEYNKLSGWLLCVGPYISRLCNHPECPDKTRLS